MGKNNKFRKYLPSQVRAYVIDDDGNLSINFGDNLKTKFIGIREDVSLKVEGDITLSKYNEDIYVSVPNSIVKFYPDPLNESKLRIVNDSGGNITLDGNSKLIDDVGSFVLYDGEVLGLVFNNNKWM